MLLALVGESSSALLAMLPNFWHRKVTVKEATRCVDKLRSILIKCRMDQSFTPHIAALFIARAVRLQYIFGLGMPSDIDSDSQLALNRDTGSSMHCSASSQGGWRGKSRRVAPTENNPIPSNFDAKWAEQVLWDADAPREVFLLRKATGKAPVPEATLRKTAISYSNPNGIFFSW